MILKYLIEKEFKQFVRNSFLPKLIVVMPCLLMLVLPWAADMTTKNVRVVVVDNDRSPLSSRLVSKTGASDYFDIYTTAGSYAAAMEYVEKDEADIILEVPVDFERDIVKTGVSEVMISANAVNGVKGSLGSSYLTMLLASFSEELREESGMGSVVGVRAVELDLAPRILYNPNLDYKKYMVPAFMVILVTLIGGFFPALNVVMEKESGTIEQINVTPVSKLDFIIAKLIPYWIMGFLVITISLVIAWLVYGIVPVGSLATVYLGFVIYLIALSGFGIVISNYSATMQQAMFVMFFFMIIFILMSGIFTPVSSMPDWAQKVTLVNPLRYFIEILRSIFFKGSAMANLYKDFLALVVFAVGANIWAVLSYRKRS